VAAAGLAALSLGWATQPSLPTKLPEAPKLPERPQLPGKYPMIPGREPTGPSKDDIEVPPREMQLGVVYRTISGKERQVTFTSEALNERINGFTNDVHGYAVRGGDAISADLKAGRWRFKVDSLRTGIAMRDQHLTEPNWLDAAKFPYVEFTFKKVKDIKPVDADAALDTSEPHEPLTKDAKAFTCTLEGELTLHGVTKSVTLPGATITLLPESEETKKLAPGNLMRIRVAYDVLLSDYGVSNDIIAVRKKVAEKISIVTDLVLNQISPAVDEQSLPGKLIPKDLAPDRPKVPEKPELPRPFP
jgi:polyisoprenoid-binding protein YceI